MSWKKIWSAIEKNRFTVIAPLAGLVLWFVAVGCVPTTISPVTGQQVNAKQLKIEFNSTMAKFEYAGEDLTAKAERQGKFIEIIMSLASGQVTDIAGLVNISFGLLGLGFGVDNVRKNAVISGLKRNKDTTLKTGV